MLHPAPTTKIDPTLTRGTILKVLDASAIKPAMVVIGIPNNSYQISLIAKDELSALYAQLGEIVLGRIFGSAKRIDRPQAGGRKFDPCIGTPTRVMGTVIAVDPRANVVVLDAGAPIILNLTAPGQRADQFAHGEFIACDLMPGTWFSLV